MTQQHLIRTDRRYYLYGFLMILLLPLPIYGQESTGNQHGWGVNSYYGGLFSYRHDMPRFSFLGLFGGELYYFNNTSGSRDWQEKYRKPQLGWSIAYFGYGQRQILGRTLSGTGYIGYPLLMEKQKKLLFKLGTGIVYASKRYDAEVNPENEAISSRFSYVLRAGITLEKQFREDLKITVNTGFRHYSNGALKMPNNGLNFLFVGVGVQRLHTYTSKPVKKETYVFGERLYINLWNGIGWKTVLPDDQRHSVHSLSFYLGKHVSIYNSLIGGIDGFKYHKTTQKNVASLDNRLLEQPSGYQLAITLGNELHFGKVSLITQAGFYIYEPDKLYSFWYQRYGLKARLSDTVFGQVSVKGYGLSSDVMEFGLGITI